MSHLFWRTEEQVERVTPFFPKERGGGRLEDRRHKFESTEKSLQSQKGGDAPLLMDQTKGGLNTKLQALCGNLGWLVRSHRTKGQSRDFKGADVLLKDFRRIAIGWG